MGIGSSNAYSGPRPRRRSIPRGRGTGNKRRRANPVRKVSPKVSPVKHRYRYSYGSSPYAQPLPAYAPLSQRQPYSGYMPMYYSNYRTPPYLYPRQPMGLPQQVAQPMMGPSQPVMMPQQAPYAQPMTAPRLVPVSMYAPPAYSAGAPLSGLYAQAPVQSFYNNIIPPSFVSPGLASSNFPSSTAYRMTTGLLSTDWTGGGKISPGFLGPPI